MVSRPVRTTLCMKSAKMAASMRGVVRRVSMGCRWVGDACLGFEDTNGSVEESGGGLGGRLVRRCGWSGGVWVVA